MKLRMAALDRILKTAGSETMTTCELDLLGGSDEGLVEDLGKKGSFVELLELGHHFETEEFGRINQSDDFNEK